MRRHETDARRLRWMDAFVTDVRDEIRKIYPGLPEKEFGKWTVFMSHLLCEVFSDGWAVGDFPGGRFCGYDLLVGNTGYSKKTIKSYLLVAARAGILKGVTVVSAELKRQRPLEIVPNPALLAAYQGQAKEPARKGIARLIANVWAVRYHTDGDIQGFDTVCEWGTYYETNSEKFAAIMRGHSPWTAPPREETGTGAEPRVEEDVPPPTSLRARITAVAEGKLKAASAKAEAEKAKKERREFAGKFVAGAARVWAIYRARAGMGTDLPPWAAEGNAITPVAKRSRNELVKLFELYGGLRAASAWSFFCGAGIVRDDAGKVVFNPAIAHRQWTTPDKKPEHFTKHISLIFQDMSSQPAWNPEKISERMAEVFGADVVARAPLGVAKVDVAAYLTPQAKGASDVDSAPKAATGG